jgi:hypothetical protein
LKKVLLVCGILSSLLYVAMNVIGAMQYEGYSSASQTISELSAIGAPSRPLWLPICIVYEVLMIAFGWGVWMSAGGKRALRVVGGFLFSFGVIGFAWPFASMHQREVLAAGGGTLTDTLHIILGMVSVLFMLMAIAFGAAAFGKRFRLYSIATILVLLVFGALTGMDSPRMAGNLPTPWMGVWERISILGFLVWVVVLAIILLRVAKVPNEKHEDMAASS